LYSRNVAVVVEALDVAQPRTRGHFYVLGVLAADTGFARQAADEVAVGVGARAHVGADADVVYSGQVDYVVDGVEKVRQRGTALAARLVIEWSPVGGGDKSTSCCAALDLLITDIANVIDQS